MIQIDQTFTNTAHLYGQPTNYWPTKYRRWQKEVECNFVLHTLLVGTVEDASTCPHHSYECK